MKNGNILLILLLSLSLFTCKKATDEFPDLRVYLDRFQTEAKNLGYDLDLSQIQAVYVDKISKPDGTFCGYGYSNYDGKGLRRIEISRDCWKNFSENERENLFFHEIGHAFFNKFHDESKLCDGSALSMMSAKNFPLYLETEVEKRKYYIAEIIDKLAANTKCIADEKDWNANPIFYKNSNEDQEWIFYSSQGKYTGQKTDVISIAASAQVNTTETGYFYKQFINPNIPECAEVKLKVKMNSSNLTGKGAAIGVRVYESALKKNGAQTEQYLFLTTEDKPVSGTLTDHIEELVIPCFSRKTTYLIIFVVMMPETSGEITFKDVQLEVKKK